MPFGQRIRYAPFLENKEIIEKGWHEVFGDRKNELVFIGQEMDEQKIREQLNACLCTPDELDQMDWVRGVEDNWPIQRAYPLGAEEAY